MDTSERIYVAGHQGLVGSAVVRCLQTAGYRDLLLRSRSDLDLCDQSRVLKFFNEHRPAGVIMCAGRVGGILANQASPADFLSENLSQGINVIEASARYGVRRLVYLGSACIYPRLCRQPIVESALLSAPLEPTNEGYAIAKIACLKLCEALRTQRGLGFVTLMPANVYGPGDRYHATVSHVIPALMLKMLEAKRAGATEVCCLGSGRVSREFIYVDDLAAACLVALGEACDHGILNVGSGEEVSIATLSGMIAEVVGFTGGRIWDSSRPNGVEQRILDSSRIRSLGWRPETRLVEGLPLVFADLVARCDSGFLQNKLNDLASNVQKIQGHDG